MRRAFTLIELLAIVAIIAAMVTSAVISVRSGQTGARLKGTVRDAFATIRHARSMALVSGQPSIITYSTEMDGDEACAKIEVHTAQIFSANAVTRAETLDGETVVIGADGEVVNEKDAERREKRGEKDQTPEPESGDAGGEGMGIGEFLFQPIKAEVLRGIRLKVLKEGDELAEYEEERAKPKISVFSNVDFLLGKFKQAKDESEKKEKEKTEERETPTSTASISEDQEPVSVVWEVNGRTEPHKVWIYPDGKHPEDGLCISVDRFGAAKVLGEGED